MGHRRLQQDASEYICLYSYFLHIYKYSSLLEKVATYMEKGKRERCKVKMLRI